MVEVCRYESRRGDDARDRERRVPERPAQGVPVFAFQDEDPPDKEGCCGDDCEVGKEFSIEQDIEPAPGVEEVVERERDARGHHKETDDRLYGERVVEADGYGLVAEAPRRDRAER